MSTDYWDAIMFKPKMDIYLCGFGFTNHYHKKPFTVKFKFVIGTEESPETEIALTTDMAEDN